MKKYLIVIFCSIVISIVNAQTTILSFFEQLQTFNANFLQTVEQDGKIVQNSKGTVWLKKPLKFRWNYQTPEPMQLVSNGQQFYHYDIDLEQVTTKPVTEVTGSGLATLLNNKSIEQIFTIQPFPITKIKKEFPKKANKWLKQATVFYNLTPKNKADEEQPKQLIVGLTKNWQLSVFYVEDNYGKNYFIFSNIKQNKKISKKKFILKVPKGVDILE